MNECISTKTAALNNYWTDSTNERVGLWLSEWKEKWKNYCRSNKTECI